MLLRSSGLSEPSLERGAAIRRMMVAGLLVALGLLAATLAGRRGADAAEGLSPGPGLIVGVEVSSELEHRGAPLSLPVARGRGAPLRACAVALCTLGLLLAVWPRRGRPVGARALARWLWAAPGAAGIHRLAQGGEVPEGGLGLAALLLLLSLSLLTAWRE